MSSPDAIDYALRRLANRMSTAPVAAMPKLAGSGDGVGGTVKTEEIA